MIKKITFDFPNEEQYLDCAIVLNGDISSDVLTILCSAAQNIILADGGANTFYKMGFKDHPKVRSVVGDLDSINQEVLEHFQNKGIEIKKVFDQNYNDLEKSIL